ncbi:hypothetical protein [Streptomyces vinaceus]|uniref:hypothetical protein n=1 Tax=Streptomyces vinaceus TaxID=1960 RepID=UPI00380A4A1B
MKKILAAGVISAALVATIGVPAFAAEADAAGSIAKGQKCEVQEIDRGVEIPCVATGRFGQIPADTMVTVKNMLPKADNKKIGSEAKIALRYKSGNLSAVVSIPGGGTYTAPVGTVDFVVHKGGIEVDRV